MNNPRIADQLRNLDQAFDHSAWHGPNLMNSLRRVTAEEAAWRPDPERHNIWELVLHAAYWKYRVYRHLTDEPPRSFGRKGSNFFERPMADEQDWKGDLDFLKTWHVRLRRIVAEFDPARLDQRPGRGDNSYFALISGIAFHDVYHAGQIRLLRRLREGSSNKK